VSATRLLGTLALSGQESKLRGDLEHDPCAAAAALLGRTVEITGFVED
jgi:hypothetical protein